jgi:hypothetical protein
MSSQEQSLNPASRIPLHLDVGYKKNYGRSQDAASLKNISITGAFLEHNNDKLSAQEKISITFEVGGRERIVQATVVWSNKFGSGVKFLPTNNRDVQIVDDLIYYVEEQRTTRRSILQKIFKQVG